MASEKDFELLDQYVGNRLSTQEKAAFEQKLSADAELKSELTLQQKIVEGIRNARAAELKQMLNNVPLSSIPSEGNSMLVQTGIWVAAAGIIGTGLYFYLTSDEPAFVEPTSTEQVVEALKDAEQPPEVSQEELIAVEPEKEEVLPVEVQTKTAKVQAEVAKKDAPVAAEEVVSAKPVAPRTLDVFDPTEEIEKANDGTGAVSENEKEPAKAPSIIVETASDKRYEFHYQFKNEKLYLYGAFEKNLYEIMEFFSDNKRTMFLFYKDNYYLLNEESDKVKALAPITDPALLKKLKDYRGK